MLDPIIFDSLEPRTRAVEIGGKQYVLREASGGVGVEFRNMINRAQRLSPDGKSTVVEGLEDACPWLVSRTLFESVEVNENGAKVMKERPVPERQVREWPDRVQRRLFEESRILSDLNRDDTVEGLTALIDMLQRRLEVAREKESVTKNGHAATPAYSA
jgi:hypothetical protein